MSDWGNFFVAEVGAAATLAGLIFVGVSINIRKIIAYPGLPNRVLEPLIMLLVVLLVSSLQLVPGQPSVVSGSEVMLIGLVAWVTLSRLHIAHMRNVQRQHVWQAVGEVILGQAATLPFIIAGVLIVVSETGGRYWMLPAMMCSFLIALYNAWILLIEVNR